MEARKFLAFASLALVADFIATFYTYAIAHDWIITQALVGFLLPFINFFGFKSFVDAKSTVERLKITLAIAIGATLGSTLMLLMVKIYAIR